MRLPPQEISVRDQGIALARSTPHHTAASPRTTLRQRYKPEIRTAPSCRLEKISHSNVENVLYAPTNPIEIRYRHAGVNSTRSPRYSRENPMIRHAVRLITNVP